MARLGHSSNLGWSGIVLQLTFPGRDRYPDPSVDEEEVALAALFDLLDQFLVARDQAGATDTSTFTAASAARNGPEETGPLRPGCDAIRGWERAQPGRALPS